MKYILFLFFLSFACSLSAQEKVKIDPEIKKLLGKSKLKFYKTEVSGIKGSNVMKNFRKGSYYSTHPNSITGKLIDSLSNGNKVYATGYDNMPCIIPDMSHFNMPNAGIRINPYGILNPGTRIFIMPKS